MDVETPKPRAGRGVKLAFGLSLALNLVFVGLIAGTAWRFAGPGKGLHGGGPGMKDFGAPYVRALPREDRKALLREVRGAGGGLPSRSERQAMRLSLIAAVRAETFDTQAVREIFATQTDAAQSVLRAAQEAWIKIVAGKTAAEREQLAETLEEMLKRRKGKHGPKK